jgi:uncharacterized protein
MAGELHEKREDLPEDVLDFHRAISSLMEELEAVDWYRQRAAATKDPELKAILDHHQREELEHAMMLIEYMRRKDRDVDTQLREYVFKQGSIIEAEEKANE